MSPLKRLRMVMSIVNVKTTENEGVKVKIFINVCVIVNKFDTWCDILNM